MKRYNIIWGYEEVEESPDGPWVSYDDVKALLMEAYTDGAFAYNADTAGYIADVREHAEKWVEGHAGESRRIDPATGTGAYFTPENIQRIIGNPPYGTPPEGHAE